MNQLSVYEVECLCGEKVRTLGKAAICGKCGREIEIESWQIRHTMTAQGLLIENGGSR
jgi:hypothetical protein